MTFLSFGSNTKNSTTPRKLNIRQDLPPSWLMYEPVISQLTSTVSMSCGLTVGWNMAPPPPGPTTVNPPGRSLPPPTAKTAHTRHTRRNTIAYFPLLSFCFLRLSFWQKPRRLSTIPSRPGPGPDGASSGFQVQRASGVFVINLAKNRLGQPYPVDPPAPLRGNGRRRVVKILIFAFKKPVVDLIQCVAEDLLRRIRSVRHGIGSKQYAVLIPVKKLPRSPRLTAELADSGSQFDAGVRKTVETVADVCQILGVVPHMQQDEVRLRMARENPVSGLQELGVAREVLAVKRPVRVIVQFFESFVEPVGGQKERFGIGNMDRHGHVQGSAGFPHRIEAAVIDLHQRALGDSLAQIKAERLQHLQTARPGCFRASDCVGLDFFIPGTGALVPKRFGERHKPVCVGLFESFDRLA